MRLPIRNYLSTPLTIFIEPMCDRYEVPVGDEATVVLADGHRHSIDIHPENCVSIWNEGPEWVVVEIFNEHQFSILKRGAQQRFCYDRLLPNNRRS